jgi:hypothetical protein
VQGRLRNDPLTVQVTTQCAQSGQQIQIALDVDLKYTIEPAGIAPLIFEPEIEWARFREPNIIHAY